jgi:hypothetical protein
MLAQPASIEPESVSSKPTHDPSFLEPEFEEDSQDTAPRKRHIGSNSENERQLKRARLTRGNLALFDKMTKKKIDTKVSLLSGSTADSSKTQTKTISTTSSGFEVQATKNGILLSTNSKAPKNAQDLVGRLNQSRDTASPTESIFGDYVDTVTKVPNEATTSHETAPLLKGYRDRAYSRAWNQAFTAYPKNVGFNNGLSAPQPDFVQGFRQLEFEPFPIGEELDSAVLFNDDQNSIALPHFAGEWKGPGNDMDQAALQSAYDGAALVHSRNEALAYVGKSDPAGHASVLTVTTDGRAINVFGHYVAPSAGGDKLKYHQYRLTTAHMDESYEDFKKGRKQLRNAQDFAKEQSYQLREQLQDYWKTQHGRSDLPSLNPAGLPSPAPNGTLPLSTQPDPDEDKAAEYEIVEPPPDQCTPPTRADQLHQTKQRKEPSTFSPLFPEPPSQCASGGGHKRKAISPSSSQLSKTSRGPDPR